MLVIQYAGPPQVGFEAMDGDGLLHFQIVRLVAGLCEAYSHIIQIAVVGVGSDGAAALTSVRQPCAEAPRIHR